ncbi:hypothetical protein Cantr_04976 [Candida viswanathii]|uniref:Endonuclease/exonuclease/phosphatase domain-containing protein n=1 Tax=Candida viswanathii TaxID=5486 RepID=A0A367XRN8_9ASCO|nr:hypothetical protein Cantr_04976 [Candida viswanathii]
MATEANAESKRRQEEREAEIAHIFARTKRYDKEASFIYETCKFGQEEAAIPAPNAHTFKQFYAGSPTEDRHQHQELQISLASSNSLTCTVKRLKELIYGTEENRALYTFQNAGDFKYMVLQPQNEQSLIPMESNGVQLQGQTIETGSIRVKVAQSGIPKRNANIASKNLGWSKPVTESKARMDLDSIIQASPNMELISLQETKTKEKFRGSLKENHKFLQTKETSWTGFLTCSELLDVRVTNLEVSGRLSVLYHPTLPALLFNPYFLSSNYRGQYQEAKILERRLSTARTAGAEAIATGDFNNVESHCNDIVEHSRGIIEQGRSYQPGEREIIDFLARIFSRFGLTDVFRHQNSRDAGPTNHPYCSSHAEEELIVSMFKDTKSMTTFIVF